MASSSGIRARDYDREESSTRKPILRDATGYISWATKIETILDAEDCWEIVQGTEHEPIELGWVVNDVEGEGVPSASDVAREAAQKVEIKDFRRRFKKATTLITPSLDNSLVPTMIVLNKQPAAMWAQLAANFNTLSPAQLSLARRNFPNFTIEEDESYLVSKRRFNDLLLLVTSQGGFMSGEDQLQTLLASLPERFDTVRETYFTQVPAPSIDYIWTRMFDRVTTEKRREQSAAMRGEVY